MNGVALSAIKLKWVSWVKQSLKVFFFTEDSTLSTKWSACKGVKKNEKAPKKKPDHKTRCWQLQSLSDTTWPMGLDSQQLFN